MTPDTLIVVLAGIIGSIIGVMLSALVSRKYLVRKTFTPSNAVDLLELSHPEEWNEVRILNPDWAPDLKNALLDQAVIPAVNLSRADLSGASFRGAILDGADFSEAKLTDADFSQASLVGARLDYADLRGAQLTDALLLGVSLHNAKLGAGNLLVIPDNTETDQLKGLQGNQLLSRVVHNPDLIDQITPPQFEDIVATVFRSLKYKVDHKEKPVDEGYDLLVTKSDPVTGEQRYVVEVKRTKKDFRVSESSLRALYTGLLKAKANRGILVTTNELTASAHRFAEQIPELVIIDRNKLFDWLKTAVDDPTD